MNHSTAKMTRDLGDCPGFTKVGRCLHAFIPAFRSVRPSSSVTIPRAPNATAFPWPKRPNSPLSLFEITSVGFQHRVEEPDVWASSFYVWLDFHHVAVEPACVFASLSRCRSLLVGTECKYVDDSKSLNRASSCAESFRCTWVIRSVTSASTASSSPARCCFLGTSLDEAPLLLAGFRIPLNYAPPVCGHP